MTGNSQSGSLFSRPLQGIIPPLVTPLIDRDEIDEDGTRRLLDHVMDGGVSAVFILGTTGEAPSLSYRLRREFIQFVCLHVAGRVPVLVGITDTAYVESIALSHVAHEAGAAAVVLSTPYYFPAGQTELTVYVRHVVEELPLPLILYNMPSLTKVWFEIETLQQLAELPGIVGVKDSGGDLEYFERLTGLKQHRPDWTIMIGPEHLLAESIALGGDGGVHGGANIYPDLFVGLLHAIRDDDEPTASRLQRQVEQLQEIYDVGKYASRFIKATKCGLSLKGICSDFMAEPFNHFLEPQRTQVKAILDAID